MSEVLAVIKRGAYGICPTLRIRCAGCGRVYVGTMTRAYVRARRWCMACRPAATPRLAGPISYQTAWAREQRRARREAAG